MQQNVNDEFVGSSEATAIRSLKRLFVHAGVIAGCACVALAGGAAQANDTCSNAFLPVPSNIAPRRGPIEKPPSLTRPSALVGEGNLPRLLTPWQEVNSLNTDSAGAVALSRNGKLLAVGDLKGGVMIRDAETFQKRTFFIAFNSPREVVNSLTFSADGRRLLAVSEGSRQKQVRVFDVETGRLVADFWNHVGFIESASISADGSKVVTTASGDDARIWSVAQKRDLKALPGTAAEAENAIFSPNNRLVLTSSATGTPRLWNVRSGRMLSELRGHVGAVKDFEFSRDGSRILTLGADGKVIVWKTRNGSVESVISDPGLKFWTAVFSPDGTEVFTTQGDTSVQVWNVQTRERMDKIQVETVAQSVTFSDSSSRFLIRGSSNKAWVASLENVHQTTLLDGRADISTALIYPSGQRVLTRSRWHGLKQWEQGR